MNRPRIIVFAYSEPGYVCLNELIKAKANIVAVYTHQDDPDEEIWFHSVYDLAKQIIYLCLDLKRLMKKRLNI